MKLTKEEMLKRKWVKLDINPEDWPNPKSTAKERRFYATVDGGTVITMRAVEFEKLWDKYRMVPQYV